MGLDIYFNRFRRTKYAEYKAKCKKANKELKDFEKSMKEKYHSTDFNIWSEKDQQRYHELYQALPSESDYGTEIGYFRKVNFLMEFFHYEGNCEDKEISLDEVKELAERCTKVLMHKGEEDEYHAKHLLPTQEGFFFGSTEYNDYYYQDVKEVGEWATKVVEETDAEKDIIVMYCWW